ncbi:dsDNA nuclease domain-containing protein [Bradyrhizobium sp. AC87j1]|uniref:HamA C-terminal domain-containing protein n=1 Tax=Bradyrhizobium sp. AC87j1 TaxID=2055894 RepID=UPI0013750D87|nr:dsDNA nuclease domain-containing protein [Bradyrhizobium sp. AC87j1]
MNDLSDAGGVAARIGFKYQDHVAASFVLDMIGDPNVLQVECETSDDITRILRDNGAEIPEYVQVKTTDRDTKWTSKEITDRANKKTESSLIEKSLLADKHQGSARFRIVTRRSVNSTLSALLDPLERRDPAGEIAALAKKLKAKHPKTLSANGHDLSYWTLNAVWDVRSGLEYIEPQNLQLISRLSEQEGHSPSYSQVKRIYLDLLNLVDEAAAASRRDKTQKIITRPAILTWWNSQIDVVQKTATAHAKPYRTRGARFFVQVHDVKYPLGKRRSLGYDAQYERKVWRSEQLSKYLVTWIAELSLKASELVEIDQLNLGEKLEAGLRAIRAQRNLNGSELLGEALLHAILRHYFGSEPVACKIFHRSVLGDRITRNAHIICDGAGDQLWLGRTYLYDGTSESEFFAKIVREVSEIIETEVLQEEKQAIIQLREPLHLSSSALWSAFNKGASIDRMIEIICVPVLIAYDSAVLQAGYADDYQGRLETEISRLASRCLTTLPERISEVKIHLIFVPVEDLSVLTSRFEREVGLS